MVKINKYIIVAEDDQFYAKIFKIKLLKEGYETLVLEDGEKALKAIYERKPDLLLLDLVMPVKNGFEVLKELRANKDFKDVKVLVLSNFCQEEELIRAKKYGILDYLVKTNLSINEVVAKIKEYLK